VPSGYAIVYADEANIRAYTQGGIVTLGVNPEGYDSLDFWFGYLEAKRAVIFQRDPLSQPRLVLLGVDFVGHRVFRLSAGYRIGPEEDTLSMSLTDGRLCQMRGVGRSAALWECRSDGNWRQLSSWRLPASVPLRAKWFAGVAVMGTHVLFSVPCHSLFAAELGKPHVQVLYSGDPSFRDDGSQIWGGAASRTPVLSPSGSQVAWTDGRSPDDVVGVLNLKTRRYTEHHIPHAGFVAGVQWFDDRYLACEAYPPLSGMSDLWVVNTFTSGAVKLPVMVERDSWCVVPTARSGAPGKRPVQKGPKRVSRGSSERD
jgi:hypothetical protein